ncbi:integrator complex subunit 1 [Harmonia axyridis]|uniref:integrator complex subunit 1 n=1 Tax=Harmonia axyridis TaxID=115357 RepID=UPI001E275D71|nr:integrator complex subunit 1 [Harmonia axyridis]
MDRSKPIPGTRGPKAKMTQQPPDMFIALGAKQSSSSRDDSKRPTTLSKPSTSHMPSTSSKSGEKLKREASSLSLSNVPVKKMKVSLPGARSAAVPTLHSNERTQVGAEPWETLALECEASDLFENIMNNINIGNSDKAVGYILGAIRTIKNQRFKLCKITYSSLLLTCGCKPATFTNENILAAIISVIRRDVNGGFKTSKQSNSYIHILLINLLTHAYSDIGSWPEVFVKIFVEDALGDRIWIDNPYCKPFVDNIITAFNTKLPPKSLFLCENWNSVVRDTSSPLTINSIDDEEAFGEHKGIVDGWNTKIYPRYNQNQDGVEQFVLEALKEQLNRRQQPETISKNFIRFLSIACGLVEIRVIAVSRIETWLHNHKHMKSAQELLAYLCYNCSASTPRDMEVISQLSKLRLKSKPMLIFFNNCLKEMVYSSPTNLYPLMKYTVYNELSNTRNNNNLVVVGGLFQVAPEASADAFADICLELLLNKDDYLRSVRALLKEINRVSRHELNLYNVVHSLLKERRDFTANVKDSEVRDRVFLAVGDLATMCMLLCVNPTVRDAVSQAKRDTNVLKAFQAQVSQIQKEAVTWLQESAMRIFRPSASDYHHVLLKVLFLEQAEHYCKVDSWPGENERNLFLRLASEVRLLEGTVVRILLIGMSKENVVHPNEALDIIEQLIKRAANLPTDLDPPLSINNLDIFEMFFNLCNYVYPENIVFPPGYVPPTLALSVSYWKVWLILLILAAHNPTTVGNIAWTKYPTLRMLMEMCITNYFSFPPPTMVLSEEDFQNREQQIITLERQKIIEFETHFAAGCNKAEITEQNSFLLHQCMELKPEGEVRRPTPQILEQLQNLNNSHRLGHLLCRSRNPDFLLDIMSRQGGTAHMPWLAELVHSSEGAMAHLPVQCLCEYLLSTAPAEKLTKQGQLLSHLRTVVNSNDPQMACEVLEYLFRRLTSDHGASRTQATKGLILILSPTEDTEVNTNNTTWLTHYIYQFPHFLIIKPVLIQFLRQALQCETNPARVSSYINFLSTQDCIEPFSELSDLVADLSSVIIERHSVASYVLSGDNNPTLKNLISIFYLHIRKSLEYGEETINALQNFTTSEYVLVTWPTGEQSVMLILVIHAAIVLLTYGPIEDFEPFNLLLNMWFPKDSEHPRAYHVETTEETSYLPDWIKLRMIRSNVSHLVDAAIEKLEPQKLILFIQSFGIPTNSMSKLLCTLDKTTLQNPKLVVDSVLDKTYMIQLVEVQNKRGAVGGDTFVKAIEMQLPPVQDVDVNLNLETKKPLPLVAKKTSKQLNEKEVVNLCKNLFDPRYLGDKDKIVSQIVKATAESIPLSNICFNYLKSLADQFIITTVTDFTSVSLFFKILLKNNLNQPGIAEFASTLLKSIPKKNSSIAAVLTEFLKKSLHIEVEEEDAVTMPQKHSIEQFFKDFDKKEDFPENILHSLFSALENGSNTGENEILDNKELQKIIFRRKNVSCRPFFMSLALQKDSWQNLHNLMQYIFEQDVSNICPVSALDYLTALSQSPKLWQGRDKAFSKHDQFDDVLKLDFNQLTLVVQFILEEAKLQKENWKTKMEFRLQLLLKCIGTHAPQIVKSLLESSDERSQELMLLIYMSLPAAGQGLVNEKLNLSKEAYSKNCPSAVDQLSHTLLSALTATPRVKDWNRKSADLNVCARKLASTHPILILRQLPMLAGSLKGRAQYDWNVMKNRGHLNLFRQIFGLMELLQPMIFEQTKALGDLLDSYFLLLQYHGHSKDLYGLVQRLVIFIQNWMQKDIKLASKYLQDKGSIINEIQFYQPAIRPLLSNISLPTGEQNTSSEILVGTVTPRVSEPLPQNWCVLLAALQDTENISALYELEHLTAKRPELLKHTLHILYNCVKSSNGAIRSIAINLILKWLKFNPKASEEALSFILTSLDSDNGDIIISILERLPEIVCVMQEYAKIILTRVFKLGMKSTINTSVVIQDSINMLCLQSGC